MSDNKHIYRFLRCFNRNKVIIVLSKIFHAVNFLYVALPLDKDIKFLCILLSVVFALNGIVWIFEDRKDNNSVFMVFGSSLSMIAVASWMAYYFSRYVMIFVAVEVCILVFVWFLKPILQKMLK